MLRALIIEDEAPARQKLRRWLQTEPDIQVVGEAEDGHAAAQAITELSPDLIFLDIRIPEINGIELAASLDGVEAPMIVFVTAYDEYAASAFDQDAIDYLLKPYDRERLTRCLDRIRHRIDHRVPALRPLFVPVGNGLRVLDPTSVTWVESEDNYVRVHTHNCDYLIRRTLQDLLTQLGEDRFARIHRCRAVNIAEIEKLLPLPHGDAQITLRGGIRLRMSRRFRQALFAG